MTKVPPLRAFVEDPSAMGTGAGDDVGMRISTWRDEQRPASLAPCVLARRLASS
jgi:hypothetical protein